jgi:O-antigen/teichoic acid export membrane protein
VSTELRDLTDAARRGVRWTALNAGVGAGLQLLQIAVLARFLPPEDFGRMAMVLVILGIGATFAEFGLSSAIIQRPEVRRSELGTLYVINLLVGLTLFVVLWSCAPRIDALLKLGEMSGLIRGAALIFVVSPWGLQIRALLQKRLEFRALTAISLSALAVGTAVAVGLATASFGVWALLIGHLTTEATAAVLLLATAIRRKMWPGVAWDMRGVRGYLSFGSLRLAAMVANAVNARVDQLAIGPILGATALGYYNVAQRLAVDPVQKINPIVTRVAFPVFSLVQADSERLRRGYLRLTELLVGINAPLLLGLAATAHLVVPVVLGPRWDEAVALIRILSLYALARSVGNAGGALILAKGRADWSFYWNIALLLVLPGAVWSAASLSRSVEAVALTLLALQTGTILVHYALLLRNLIGPCGLRYAVGIGRPVVAAGLMAGVVWLCDGFLAAVSPLPRLVILVAVGVVTYTALSLVMQRTLVRELSELAGMRGLLAGQSVANRPPADPSAKRTG